jgi:hypothetical protein
MALPMPRPIELIPVLIAALIASWSLGANLGCGGCDWEGECLNKEGHPGTSALCSSPAQIVIGGDLFDGELINWSHTNEDGQIELCSCKYVNEVAQGCTHEAVQ